MISNFSKREKALIIALLILLIGLIYYRFIHINVTQARDAAREEASQLRTELDIANSRLARIKKMSDDMERGGLTKMGSYNSSKPETAFLNAILSTTPNYSMQFDEVTRDGDQIRRNFKLRFTTSSYADAKKVMQRLTDGDYRCQISDASCNIDAGGSTTMQLNGTFYETMVGGKEDSALPPDQSKQNDEVI